MNKIKYTNDNFDDEEECVDKQEVSQTKIERFEKMYNVKVIKTSAKINQGIIEAIDYLINHAASSQWTSNNIDDSYSTEEFDIGSHVNVNSEENIIIDKSIPDFILDDIPQQ